MSEFDYKVSLRIFHPSIDPDELADIVGIEPSVKWKANSLRSTPKGKLLEGVYENTYCSFELPQTHQIELSEFLKKCNNRLESCKKSFHDILKTNGEIEYYIGWFSQKNSGEIFDLELLGQLVNLGVKLSIDVYCPE